MAFRKLSALTVRAAVRSRNQRGWVNDWTRSWGFHRGPCPAWSCSTLRKVIFASSETQALRKKSQEKASAAINSSARAQVRLTGQG